MTAARADDDCLPPPHWSSVVYTDPVRQLRYEIEQTWLHHLPECDRDGWPLRRYTFGPGFVESVTTPLVSRQRIIDVIVDVLTRRVYSVPARSAHPHHRGTATIKRADGATAYRAYVRHGTPGAPRILWWECVDSSVELAWIGHHDDPLP